MCWVILAVLCAQDPSLFPVESEGKWGYIDANAHIVIEARYDAARPFSEGYAAVAVRVKSGDLTRMITDEEALSWGFIDTNGNYIIKPQFADAGDFASGLAPVVKTHNQILLDVTGGWGFISQTGNWRIGPNQHWSYAEPFSEEVAPVQVAGKGWRFVDKKGKFAFSKSFSSVETYSHGLAPAKNADGFWGFIDKNGEWVIDPDFLSAESFSEDLAVVSVPANAQFWPVRYTRKYGYIDKEGNWALEPKYVKARSFSEGLAPVIITIIEERNGHPPGAYSYINKKGKAILKTRYPEAFPFRNGLARVELQVLSGKPRYIDKQGDLVWPKEDGHDKDNGNENGG